VIAIAIVGERARLSNQLVDDVAVIDAVMRSYIRDAAFTQDRVRRIFGDRPQSAPPPFGASDPTGIHRFERAREA